jgi:hypothetical protein
VTRATELYVLGGFLFAGTKGNIHTEEIQWIGQEREKKERGTFFFTPGTEV